MQLQHVFTVPVDRETTFAILSDILLVAGCMPGATVDKVEEDGSFSGQVEVRLGPMQVTYRGEARFVELDETRGSAVLEAKGRELRGSGTARARVSVQLEQRDSGETGVSVETDLHITGRPAQFGRGVIGDVSDRLLSQFAACLQDEISRSGDEVKEGGP
ncbi:MAG: SRPBCC family protein [Acidimicrobiia bacterium]